MPHSNSISNSSGRCFKVARPEEPVQLLSIPLRDALSLQRQAFENCLQTGRSALLWCEHPPTLSLGRRRSIDIEKSDTWWEKLGAIDIVEVDRGGAATYHGPGQIVLYPIVSLRSIRVGPRAFIEKLLSIFVVVLGEYGICAQYSLERPGIWVDGRKLGSVGIKISHGVVTQGFSINYDCDLRPFSQFTACNLPGVEATSLQQWFGGGSMPFSRSEFIDRVTGLVETWINDRS